jgi:hypothetical protein
MKPLLSLFATKSLQRFVRSPQWTYAFVVAVVLCVLAYLVNGLVSEVNAGNWWGLTYGMLATALMLGAALYGIRRRKLNTDIGKSRTWVQFHIYGGTVFMLLIFMHSGFHLPSGMMNWWLWLLSLWVTVSGIVGVALQKWIPKLLTSGLAIEAIYEQIPELVAQIRDRAEKLAGTCADPVRDFYQRNVAGAMAGPNPRAIYYIDITGGIQSRMKQFEYLRQFVSGGEREKVDELSSLYKTKLELDAHYTLQKALRWWLYTHVPISLVLIVLVALHVYAVWYY